MSSIICYDSDGKILNYFIQWDVNQKLVIKGADTSSAPDFHFLNTLITDAFIVKSQINNGGIIADVPDEILQYDVPVIVYICYKEGTTEHIIRIPVMPRKKPDNYIYTESSSGGSSATQITVVNNLTTNNTKAALSAAQGVVIQSRLEELDAQIDSLIDTDEMNLAISNALNDFECGSGEPGEDGATFVPNVDTLGNLSWSNNKNLENPETVNIKGPRGEIGEPGRGIVSILKTAGTGAAGTTDVYTISYTDGTTSIFSIYNGANGRDGVGGSGEGGGVAGVDGATFTPYLDENGNLSWSNDKGLANPSTVNIKGPKGDDGADGIGVTHYWEGTKLFITSASGVSYAELKGAKGDSGNDGISVSHNWDGTVLTVTSGSGTSSVDLKGEKGDTGATGNPGYTPVRGIDYWTTEDINDIKSYVEDAILGGAW